MSVKASSKWMWHGAFPWVYSHAEGSWWYMKAGSSSPRSGWMWHGAFPWVYSHNESAWRYMKSTSTEGKFYAWKQGDKKWYSFNEIRNAWDVLPGQNKAGDTYTIPDLSLKMIWVEPGTFMMGSPDDEEGRDPRAAQHRVRLTKGFWLGKYEVTQVQWEKLMGNNPSIFSSSNQNLQHPSQKLAYKSLVQKRPYIALPQSNPLVGEGASDMNPVENVSWNDVTLFCDKLTRRESEAGRLPAGMAYQLPTEAQWEYACRAGTLSPYSLYRYHNHAGVPEYGQSNFNYDLANAEESQWTPIHEPWSLLDTRSYPRQNPRPITVGMYAANAWGFHDMHGNVAEWCADWYGDYPTPIATDPVGTLSPIRITPAGNEVPRRRVNRGGSFFSTREGIRSASRSSGLAEQASKYKGFRLSLRASVDEADQSSVALPEEEQLVPTSNTAGDTYTVSVISMEMIWVDPGTFFMGDPDAKPWSSDNIEHKVTLTEGFWLGKYEATQAQWEKLMLTNPTSVLAGRGSNRPVANVSWADVTWFCEILTALESEAGRLPSGLAYQLPTEAQWEYACRAGTRTAFSFGDSSTFGQANIFGVSRETTAVGKYPANQWNFHDMHGNISEWCADWHDNYPADPVLDPTGPVNGSYRIFRGGSWYSSFPEIRSAVRSKKDPDFRYEGLGFRLSLRPVSK